MATTTRTRPRRGTPVSGAGKGMLGRVAGGARRGWRKTLRRHPAVGIVTSIVLAVIGVALLALGLLAENLLYYLAMGLSALGSVATARAGYLERQRQEMRPRVARPGAGPQAPEPDPSAQSAPAGPRPSAGPVLCTATRKPVEACDCASRHVATGEGSRRYGLPVGSPMGKRRKPAATKGDTA